MQYLEQSTSPTITLGPFVDATDGYTPEEALTISQADVRLSKNGAAFAQKNESTSATHDENGWYRIPLNTTDTGTLGRLIVAVYETGARPVHREFMVVPAEVYGGLVDDTDTLPVDVQEIDGNTTSADYLNDILTGTGQVLTLSQLRINSSAAGGGIDIDNDSGPAIDARGTTYGAYVAGTATNSTGLASIGKGTGSGINATGETGGTGIYTTGGIGIDIIAQDTDGIQITANDTGHGIQTVGGSSGSGIVATAGNTGSGAGISATGSSNGGAGIDASGGGGNAGIYAHVG
ncbi:MAG: hypothetical protein GF334_00135, partial [Candidatus Altiarchaeales archaeon]|nr:hypothetical protein [Candidatus Altiarchaeales archaeon]